MFGSKPNVAGANPMGANGIGGMGIGGKQSMPLQKQNTQTL